ncbi:ATP-dependent (S)-NAD(P)H-hydrate dehydratase [Polystyrenella longa]|uniref:ADP-dependent (S)-NAD(P)H-hydrate dehydratase n=1 Tax=Polystyrenella longa TaxID=2528007 RepID=A0A518CU42_9PLAN|nr:NAD(P)H-hydrate dehydratase [Polystyrenella longa]QDU82704.1 ATP-dependent (S)-NAD(P)H-hydrate dehydratase [Polystyrenella longa]
MIVDQVTDLPRPPQRPASGHKGTFGRTMLIGGSRGMGGAISLSGMGALRSGAGLVYLVIPKGIADVVAGHSPSYLTIPLPEDDSGRISSITYADLKSQLKDKDSLGLGPGCGQSDHLKELFRNILLHEEKPIVVDADALNMLADMLDVLHEGPVPRVLTPHPGEFSRLANLPIKTIDKHRQQVAAEFADVYDVTLILKGEKTIVTDGHRMYVNPTGNSGMATGGTGDVLTGIISGLLAQGMLAFEAAQLGTYLHGLSGDLAAQELSQPGMISSDLPRYLGKAWQQFYALHDSGKG